ncbi:ANTAR domain-containing protein [Frankia sp. Cas4]|uniref:ANTAR domain-containing protein n=1 Tax=Frankia sp. Cas4 TaxID=3073927 RepID=UPI002AD5A85B|nr:ANTAR domain-containing protein [Frankia sp. Cas4]
MWSAVDVALQAAGAVHRMEATAFVVLSASTATYQRTTGALPGLDAGLTLPRSESVGARVLDGAPVALTEVSDEPAVAGTDEPARLGVRSYVAVAVLGGDGRLHGLLVGLDRAQVTLTPSAIILLRGIADAVGALMDDAEHVFEHSFERSFEGGTEGGTVHPEATEAGTRTAHGTPAPSAAPAPSEPGAPPRPSRPAPGRPAPPGHRAPAGTAAARGGQPEMRLRRSPTGWIVEGPGGDVRPVGDLLSAMVLADLLAEDLAPPGRPRRPDHDLTEVEALRLSVVQLEHALASRVIVEQAIGVLAERHHIRPREAFERLRRTARGMGRRVHDLARQVIESVSDPRAVLPGELAGRGGASPRPAPPRANQARR